MRGGAGAARGADLARPAPVGWVLAGADLLWERLELDRFWGPRLHRRAGTRHPMKLDLLKIQVCIPTEIEPGQRLASSSALVRTQRILRDLLVMTFRVIASNVVTIACLDKSSAAHKQDFFSFLRRRVGRRMVCERSLDRSPPKDTTATSSSRGFSTPLNVMMMSVIFSMNSTS